MSGVWGFRDSGSWDSVWLRPYKDSGFGVRESGFMASWSMGCWAESFGPSFQDAAEIVARALPFRVYCELKA